LFLKKYTLKRTIVRTGDEENVTPNDGSVNDHDEDSKAETLENPRDNEQVKLEKGDRGPEKKELSDLKVSGASSAALNA